MASNNCRVCLWKFYKESTGYMSTENLFKPSNKKDCRGVVLANILESVGIPLDRSETYSHRVCNPCGRKIRNLGSLYALIHVHVETRKPEENPSREAVKVPAKSKDVGKRLFCEFTPVEQWHIQQATQSTDLRVKN